jgi:glycosyltransferase involved in cell wall biosynthesis
MCAGHIVLITSGQPATNPRLVKEADLFTANGYQVTVLYCYWNKWATLADQQLMATRKWKLIQVAGSPAGAIAAYYKSKLLHKLAGCTARISVNNKLSVYALSRATLPLVRAASRIPADLYLAHNLAALPAAVIAARRNEAISGFDAEDYHREETPASLASIERRLKVRIEDTYIPQLDHFTTSSRDIAELYEQHYHRRPMVIRNLLPKTTPLFTTVTALMQQATAIPHATVFINPVSPPVKLVWFSQSIGPNRGIELIMDALQYLAATNYELHLLGDIKPGYLEQLHGLASRNNIPLEKLHIHKPMEPEALTRFIATFDIGLASETGFCSNNEAALSNKLFTYIQAGLVVILSDTKAQRQFYNEHPIIGICYKKDSSSALAEAIQHYINHRKTLEDTKRANYLLGQQFLNWETECQLLLRKINRILS